jgi:anti-sigma regulatory factor (Ser/Thr protein kinase)
MNFALFGLHLWLINQIVMYVIPKKLDTDYLHQIIFELEDITDGIIIFNWVDCISITDEAHCAILHLKELLQAKNIKIDHTSQTDTLSAFNKIWNCEVGIECLITSEGVYVSPIVTESRLSSDIGKILNFIKERYNKSIGDKDFSPIESILSELYMNICQHSGTEKGFIFVSTPNDQNEIFIYVSDIGIGIATNIRNYYNSNCFESDADAIEFATEGGVTTQSIKANRGLGLETLRLAISTLGLLKIISGEGLLYFDRQHQLFKTKSSYKHKGTLINIQISLEKLEEADYEHDNQCMDF